MKLSRGVNNFLTKIITFQWTTWFHIISLKQSGQKCIVLNLVPEQPYNSFWAILKASFTSFSLSGLRPKDCHSLSLKKEVKKRILFTEAWGGDLNMMTIKKWYLTLCRVSQKTHFQNCHELASNGQLPATTSIIGSQWQFWKCVFLDTLYVETLIDWE